MTWIFTLTSRRRSLWRDWDCQILTIFFPHTQDCCRLILAKSSKCWHLPKSKIDREKSLDKKRQIKFVSRLRQCSFETSLSFDVHLVEQPCKPSRLTDFLFSWPRRRHTSHHVTWQTFLVFYLIVIQFSASWLAFCVVQNAYCALKIEIPRANPSPLPGLPGLFTNWKFLTSNSSNKGKAGNIKNQSMHARRGR